MATASTRAPEYPAPEPSAPERVRFATVEGLRAVAALCVFVLHVSETRYGGSNYVAVGLDRYARAFFDELAIGVPIFFAISGFVLYRPFVARHVAADAEPSVRSYAARRVLRIYPAYVVALVGTVALFGHQVVLHGTGRWLANLTLVQSYVPGAQGTRTVFMGMLQAWTLVVEITFYATLPLLAYAVRRASRTEALRSHWTALGLVLAAGIAARAWDAFAVPPRWVTVLPVYLPLFVIGMALAVASAGIAHGHAAPRVIDWAARHPGWCVTVAVAAFLTSTVIADVVEGAHLAITTQPQWETELQFVLQMVTVAGLLIPAVIGVERGGRVRRTLSSRVAVFLGAISYGIYLWHWAVIRWLAANWFGASSGQTMLKVTIVGLPATIAIAYASYRVVERPLMNLSKRVN